VITDDVLATYVRFGGDLDDWQRVERPRSDNEAMGLALYRLAELIQRAGLVARGVTDEAFAARTRREVDQASASTEIAARIWALASQAASPS
jgi:hypothetical protein